MISILTFARFSGKGRQSLHYETSQNANFLRIIDISTEVSRKCHGSVTEVTVHALIVLNFAHQAT